MRITWTLIVFTAVVFTGAFARADDLEAGFRAPPNEAQPRVYWWWLNNLVSKEGITRDLEEFKAKGIGGVLLFNAGMPAGPTPSGPDFMSRGWRDMVQHAVREADRLGLEVSINLCSGWDAGGPWITDDTAAHHYVQAHLVPKGPQSFSGKLPQPPGNVTGYHDVAVQAFRKPDGDETSSGWRPIVTASSAQEKYPATMAIDDDEHTMWVSDGWKPGDAPTPQRPEWLQLEFPQPIETETLWIVPKSPYGPKEIAIQTSTDGKTFVTVKKHALRRDGEAIVPLAGHAVSSAEISDRFLHDFRKTVADCLAENHYARFAELARGLGIHPEPGGPCWPQVMLMDALKNLGRCDIPMGEFWHSHHWHEGSNQNTNGKQTATAAHVYGKRWVMAEAFTSIGPHWLEGPAELKATADIAFCEGINRFVHHTSTASRPEDGKPGYEYFADTHFNPNITWWELAGAWTTYISRCQWLLSQGLYVADVLYYNGDGAPNLVEPKHVDPALGNGYEYDVCNNEVLLTRLAVRDGRIVLPDGMSYRVLVLPDRRTMPVEILAKIKQLVEEGATVVGPPPERTPGLKDYPRSDEHLKTTAGELWGPCDGETVKQTKAGKGFIVWGKTLREVLTERNVAPDFECTGENADAFLDFIHRRTDQADVYYVVNRRACPERVNCSFRIEGRQPEFWNPIDGTIAAATVFQQKHGRTIVPMEYVPYGSMFVVFRKPTSQRLLGNMNDSFPNLLTVKQLSGPWQVQFDPEWGGPKSVVFEKLEDWTKRPEDGIRYYSGTANLWTNRLIGDASRPQHERLTRSAIRPPLDGEVRPSGLLGPVTLKTARSQAK